MGCKKKLEQQSVPLLSVNLGF